MPVWSAPGRPTRRSIASSGMSGEIRACPTSEKVRAVGSQNVRASVASTSVRGGLPELRSRVMTRLSRSSSGRGAGRPQQVLGHGDELVDRARRGSPPRRSRPSSGTVTGGRRVVAVVDAGDGDAQGGEGPGREGDHLPGRRQRGGAEVDGHRVAPVEGEGHRRDRPVGVTGLGLDQGEGARSVRRPLEHHLPPLARAGRRWSCPATPSGCSRRGPPPAGPRAGR